MLNFIIRRLLLSCVLVFLVSIISFFIMTMTPGSPFPWADLNPKITPAMREMYKKKFHLDQPLYKQYVLIMGDMFKGTLVSNKDEAPVFRKIGERLPATISLNLLALALAFGFGIPFGVLCARYLGKWPDHWMSILAFVLIALPEFWVAYLAMYALVTVFSVPVFGMETFGVKIQSSFMWALDHFWHLALPAVILSLGSIAVQSRYIRASLAESISEDYIRTARAKGLAEERVFYIHALRNSIRPLITGIGYLLPALLSGSVIIETIFSYPGIGQLGYQAILERDYPTLMTLNFVVAILVLVGTLIADVLYAIVDPRVRVN